MKVLEKLDEEDSAGFHISDEKANEEILQAVFDNERDEDDYDMVDGVAESIVWCSIDGQDGFQVDFDLQVRDFVLCDKHVL